MTAESTWSTVAHIPKIDYPTAADTHLHGQYPLPPELPCMDFSRIAPFRSVRHRAVRASTLNNQQLLQLARVIGRGFALREPMSRHLRLPTNPPAGLHEIEYTDIYGTHKFGTWDYESIITWFARLFVLTDPTAPAPVMQRNEESLALCYAILDDEGNVIGGSLAEPVPPPGVEAPFRSDDLLLTTVLDALAPIFNLIMGQSEEGLVRLQETYPDFRDAQERGEVVHHAMMARSDALPKEDTFQMFIDSYEDWRDSGMKYIIGEATNRYSGAALEVFNATRVNFIPYRVEQTLTASPTALPDEITTSDGFVAPSDAGTMFYVLRLR